MKYVKILSLAVMTATALLAFVGAGTASATVLCKVLGTGTPTGTVCPAGSAYGAHTVIHAVLEPGTKLRLTTEPNTIECEEATIQFETNNEGSATETVTGPEGVLVIGKCNCEVKVLKAGSLEIHWISGTHNGTLTGSGGELTSNCSTIFGSVHCIYATNATDLGTITGGNPATLDFHVDIPRLPTNALCAGQGTLEGSFEITSPKPLFVSGHT